MSNMLTSLYNGKEKYKNKLSLKKTIMSLQMKLDDKPNKIGTKKGSKFSFVFPYSAPNLHTGKIYLIYLLQSFLKKETTGGFLSTCVEDVNHR